MKVILSLLSILFSTFCFSQTGTVGEAKFHQGSNLFINGNPDQALAAVNEGLRAEPRNEKLSTLKKILEQEKKQQQQKKEQQEKEQKEKQKQQQQQKDQQNKENKEKEQKEKEQKDQKDQQQKDKEQKDKEKEDQEKKEAKQNEEKKNDKDKENKSVPPEVLEKLKDMKISEEKARMILEAMKNQEVQYLQQNKREATKPKDRSKPDW